MVCRCAQRLHPRASLVICLCEHPDCHLTDSCAQPRRTLGTRGRGAASSKYCGTAGALHPAPLAAPCPTSSHQTPDPVGCTALGMPTWHRRIACPTAEPSTLVCEPPPTHLGTICGSSEDLSGAGGGARRQRHIRLCAARDVHRRRRRSERARVARARAADAQLGHARRRLAAPTAA